MDFAKIIAEELQIESWQVQAIMELLEEGDTIPFIVRYRKEKHGSLTDEVVRKLSDRYTYLKGLDERKKTVLSSIEEQGKLTPELQAKIDQAMTLAEVEDLYRPYKPKRKTRASIAKEKGLEPLALYLLAQEVDSNVAKEAEKYLNEEKGIKTIEEAIQGAKDIVAEQISDDAEVRKYLRNFILKHGQIHAKEVQKDEKDTYMMYQDYREPIGRVAPHRVLAMNRGEAQKCLKISLEVDEVYALSKIKSKTVIRQSDCGHYLAEAIEDAYERLIFPSLENEIRSDMKEHAEEVSMVVFRDNLAQLLLVAPVEHRVVLGFDPGFRMGCKLAVVDEHGAVLDTGVVYPTEPRKQIKETQDFIYRWIQKYHITTIALGNGTASRESESVLREMIQMHHLDTELVIVNESGASVYSASPLGSKEFPQFDVNLRSAVSLARRLQDPLAELVKIDPKAIGVGQYQHDMNQKRLGEVLGGVVESVVNSVGVDLNTASPSLLTYVSGISSSLADKIVAYREEHGAFRTREELLNVPKLGPKAYEQCAGFLRIRDGKNPLDNTAVHPESYPFAIALLKELHAQMEDVGSEDLVEKLKNCTSLSLLAEKLKVGEPTLKDIVEELCKPGRDPRTELEVAELRNDVTDLKDLQVGMILNGTVRNVVHFGCYVDIGIHQDGLVHISELADRFVKDPMEVVHVNQIVRVKVIGVDVEKKRISLSIRQAK